MNILTIPFHSHLKIKKSNSDSFTFMLEPQVFNENHLGTVHACAQLALAEATSGQFLLENFEDFENKVVPVIRKTQVKYHTPAKGYLYSVAEFIDGSKEDYVNQFEKRGRIMTSVKVKLYDENDKLILTAIFEWLITEIKS